MSKIKVLLALKLSLFLLFLIRVLICPNYIAYTNLNKLERKVPGMPEEAVGKVSDFFARPVVAGIEMTAHLKVGDKIHIKGHTTDIEMMVDSMQINNVNVQEAKPGDAVGIKVTDRVRRGDIVYRVTD
jgi:translation initiation factor IF-2